MTTMLSVVLVKAAFDPDASVWYVEHSDLPGLNLEAPTIEALRDKLPGAVLDLLPGGDGAEIDVPIEIIAHTSARARSRFAA